MWNKKEISQLDATLTRVPLTLTFDLEFSRSNYILGMGGPIVMEWKGWESIGCADVKHYRNEAIGCCADWGTFDLEFSKVKLYLGIGGPIVTECKGQESIACPDVKHNHYVTPRQRILLPTGWLKMSAFPSTRLVLFPFAWLYLNQLFLIFYPMPVLAFGYCHHLRLWVCVCVYQSRACPHNNSSPIQARNNQIRTRDVKPLG